MSVSNVIYLDNAATTFPKPQIVIEATEECMKNYGVNSGRGIYSLARQAEQVIASTRQKCRELLGFEQGELIFTPGATHAINQILLGLEWKRGDVVYISPFEHNSVTRVLSYLEDYTGIQIRQLPMEKETLSYNLEETKKQFFTWPPKALVLSHVSNVCGLIAPVKKLASLVKEYNGVVVIDGAQGGPLLADTISSDIDFYVFSGHKTFYGPFGVAGFWTSGRVLLKPLLFGGTGNKSEELSMPEELPHRYEAGSHNVVAIAGLQAACDWLMQTNPREILCHERELARKLLEGLADIGEVKFYINPDLSYQTGIVSFVVEGYTAQEVAMALDQNYNIAVRAGIHCAPYAHKFLDTLPHGTVRASFGYFNSEEDINTLLRAVKEIV